MLPSFKIQSLADTDQKNVPFTFGQVFAPGDLKVGQGLRAGALSLQVDEKAMHPDGSVRHAIISGILPFIGARNTPTFQLEFDDVPPTEAAQPWPDHFSAGVQVTIAGVVYSAAPARNDARAWLHGAVVNETQSVMILATEEGDKHPHLVARWAIRDYGQQQRVNLTIENCWAYQPDPQNFTYDVVVTVDGATVYEKTGLTHLMHARWRKVFWAGAAPQIDVLLETAYLIGTRAVPNYDTSVKVAEDTLAAIDTKFTGVATEPMAVGMAIPYMPTTGGRDDIGLLPMWATAYLLSMDHRARNATLGTADLAGSWAAHYRDQNTDRPISLLDYRAMTLGRASDSYDDQADRFDAFPAPVAGQSDTPYQLDTAHQPGFAYLPYLVTGDYYYLEELQFWAMWNVFGDTPAYREYEKGLVKPGQMRAQAWSLRTLAEAAYITPDSDSLKQAFETILDTNLDYYLDTYVNTPATSNNLGVIVDGYALAYSNGTGIAPWQDDFFTSAVGHAADLGYGKAATLLAWKAKFPVLRMTDPGTFWQDAALYGLIVKPSADAPVFATFGEAFKASHTVEFNALLDKGDAAGMAASLGVKLGEMTGYADSVTGYPSNMQPALAYAVDSGIDGAAESWQIFTSRTVKPDYSFGKQFDIIPRVASTTPPPPQGNIMTYKLTVVRALVAQNVSTSAPDAATSFLAEVLSADGVTVIASTTSDVIEFPGLAEGDYLYRDSGLDDNGVVIGVPFTKPFTVNDSTAQPAPAPATKSVQLPGDGSAFTITKEQ